LSALPGEVIPPGGVDSKWRYIIIHHSATDTGTAHSFHRYHLSRGWEHGLGYHFVIGNASGAEDGRIEVGHRWRGQMTGAHCKSTDNRYNRFGIGICLVGNFENREPSAAQTANLEALVRFLASECHIAPQHIYGHGDLADTRCPGEHFSLSGLKNRLQDARHGGLGSRHSNP
jgi:N-acetyl-anhydromuramyl-L-alanine amidase AmpD